MLTGIEFSVISTLYLLLRVEICCTVVLWLLWLLSSMTHEMFCAELQRNNDMLATEYGLFAANPMGASFDQSSTGAGAPVMGGARSANQQRVTPAVSTLRRSQQPSITSPRSFVRSFVSSGAARLWAVYVTCLQSPPVLRPRTGPVRNPSNTGACTVYFKRPA